MLLVAYVHVEVQTYARTYRGRVKRSPPPLLQEGQGTIKGIQSGRIMKGRNYKP